VLESRALWDGGGDSPPVCLRQCIGRAAPKQSGGAAMEVLLLGNTLSAAHTQRTFTAGK